MSALYVSPIISYIQSFNSSPITLDAILILLRNAFTILSYTVFSQIIKAIVKEYGENSVVDYYGLTPKDERQSNIEKFQKDPKCRFFVGTPATGGYGITLTAASNMIYYSNGYDLEKRKQSEARIDRIGQKKPMTYIDILAEDTIDEKIVLALRKKVNIATEIMGEELKAWI